MPPKQPAKDGMLGRMLWDITPTVDADYPVFPGDTALSLTPTWTIGPDSPVNVDELRCTTHLGAHVDAPRHVTPDGATADQLDLTAFLGTCRVIEAISAGPLVRLEHLAAELAGDLPPRLLLRTHRQQPTQWTNAFSAWDPALVSELGHRGVLLIGTDAASLDPADSKDLLAHHAAVQHDMRILENLLLDDVPPGDYELIALPLKLAGADAAPIRAVLRSLP